VLIETQKLTPSSGEGWGEALNMLENTWLIELVTNAFNGFDVSVAKFFAKLPNVYVNGSVTNKDIIAPYKIEYFFSCKNLRRPRGKQQ
jgi:hypothetical protein